MLKRPLTAVGTPSGLVRESLARSDGSRSGSMDRDTARRIQAANKRTDMPTGNYSYESEGAVWRSPDDPQPRLGITEPEDQFGRPEVEAKEPDRQSTARRSSRGRGGMSENYDEEESGSRSSQVSRRSAQARRATDRTQTARRTAGTTGRGQKKSRRGFAAMSPEQQREIARKGGLTVSRNRRHMADIGRVGGEHSHGGRRARR